MILDRQADAGELVRQGMSARRQMVGKLLDRFQLYYPDLTYSVVWQSKTINAQAWLGKLGRQVTLYGGLALHRNFGKEGLAFVLAHETGHHLAGPPFDEHLPWLSSELRSSAWARTICLPELFGARQASSILLKAQLQAHRIGLRKL